MLLDLVSVASSDLVPSVNEFGDDDLLEDLISIISDDDNMLTIECYRHLASDDDIPLTKIYHLDPPDLIFLPSESDSSCGPSPLSLTEAGCPIPEASFSDDIALLQLVSRAPTVPIVTACKLTSWRDVHWTDEHEVIVRKGLENGTGLIAREAIVEEFASLNISIPSELVYYLAFHYDFIVFENCTHYSLANGIQYAYECFEDELPFEEMVPEVQQSLYEQLDILLPQSIVWWGCEFIRHILKREDEFNVVVIDCQSI